jgi:16S rRNA G966 N2-methylase RsmD
MSDIVFIDRPYKLKEEEKKLGAKFDFTEKKWYVPNENLMHMDFDIVELDVPYAKRQLAKDNGWFWNKDTCYFNKDKIEKIMSSGLINKLND